MRYKRGLSPISLTRVIWISHQEEGELVVSVHDLRLYPGHPHYTKALIMLVQPFRAKSVVLRSIVIAIALLSLHEYVHAGDADWQWTIVAPSVTAIDYYHGTALIKKNSNGKFKAVLQEEKNEVDPFMFVGEVDSKCNIAGRIKWPNTDAGDVSVSGQASSFQLPDETIYQVLWLLDRQTGIYLTMTNSGKITKTKSAGVCPSVSME